MKAKKPQSSNMNQQWLFFLRNMEMVMSVKIIHFGQMRPTEFASAILRLVLWMGQIDIFVNYIMSI